MQASRYFYERLLTVLKMLLLRLMHLRILRRRLGLQCGMSSIVLPRLPMRRMILLYTYNS
jgi:hypothetical protein